MKPLNQRHVMAGPFYALAFSSALFTFFIFFLTLHPSNGSAQSCSNYSTSAATGITYTSIAGSSPQNFVWRNTNSNQYDDNRSYPVPIGFDFWYLGTRYTEISVSLNGVADFSSSTSDGNTPVGGGPYGPHNVNQFTTANMSMLALAPLYGDLWTGASGTTPIATSLVYLTSGTAPNRVMTIEWINFDRFSSGTGSYNFQIKIFEITGQISFIYGTMTQGNVPSYACGINGNWTTGSATAATLLTRQNFFPGTFNSTARNNLDTLPASNSQYTFIPSAPTASPTSLSFTSVSKSGMTLNWTDNATNELGYVIYVSTDGSNFTFATQTAANATSAVMTGLNSGTTYFWRVYAVTEGNLGSALSGSQATTAAGNIVSIATGNWNSTSTWNCGCIPTSGDQVTIADGHTVSLDTDGFCSSLTIGQGTSGQLTLGDNATTRTLTVTGNLTVQNGATLINNNANATHQLILGGNLVNNGTVDLASTANRLCDVTFNGTADQAVSGSGSTLRFNNITVNKGNDADYILDIQSAAFTVAGSNFLTLNNGTFRVSAAIAPIVPFTSNVTIPRTAGLWLNHASVVLSTTGGTITLFGNLTLTSGTMNIGDVVNNSLSCYGGTVTIQGGAMNIAGRLDRAGFPILTYFNMSGGTLRCATVGTSTTGLAPFSITEAGSQFTMSGGTIIIENTGAGNLGFLNSGSTVNNVTGGLLQLGSATTTSAQTMIVNSVAPVYDFTVSNGVNIAAQLTGNGFEVLNRFRLNSGSFEPSNQNFTVDGSSYIYGTFSDNSTTGTSTLGDAPSDTVDISGATINGSNTGIMVINGSTRVETADATVGRMTISFADLHVYPSRSLTFNNNNGIKTFGGLVTVDALASFTTTALTTASNVIFRGGMDNDGTVSCNVATFNTNSQGIWGSGPVSFSGNVTITGAITITNSNTDIVSITGNLNGSVAGSTWVNDDVSGPSTLEYAGTNAPMATGVIDASANANTVHYIRNGAQSVKGGNYWDLILSTVASSTKTLITSATTVGGNFTINSLVTFDPVAQNFTVNGSAYIYGVFGDGNTGGTSTLGDAATDSVDLSGGLINGSATGNLIINGTIKLPAGSATMTRMNVTVTAPLIIPDTRSLTLSGNNGIRTFQESVTVESGATWTSTTVTTAGNLLFNNGITNDGSFSAAIATFQVNAQSLNGSGTLNFSGVVRATGIQVTNNTTVSVSSSSAGALTGTGSWVQGSNSTLLYSGSTITIAGGFNAQATDNTVDYNLTGGNQTVFNALSGTYYHLTLSNTTTTARTKTLAATTTVLGNLTINGGNTIFSVSNFDLTVGGNWDNTSTNADPFVQGTRSVTFAGNIPQTISNSGDPDGTGFNNLEIKNTSTGVNLTGPAYVNNNFILTDGILFTDSIDVLTLNSSATATSGNDSTYVDGPLVKVGTAAFVFPLGNNGRYARLGIGTVTSSSTFMAQYYNTGFSNTTDMALTPTPVLNNVSKGEYWTLHELAGTGTTRVTLYWEDAAQSGITNCSTSDLRVAHWNGSGWENNNDSVTVTGGCAGNSAGTVTTFDLVTTYSPFAFGSKSDAVNPLPIVLLSFNAYLEGDVVRLDWKTASEINNDYFTVERSVDLNSFEQLVEVPGAGNSHGILEYSVYDLHPFAGTSYYRLKQTDFDGKFTYSGWVAVTMAENAQSRLNPFPNPTNGMIYFVNLPVSQYQLKIYSSDGKLLVKQSLQRPEVDLGLMPAGIYFIELSSPEYSGRCRIVRQ